MNLFKRSIELVVIRDIFNPQNNIETYTGYDVELLLRQAFGGNGLSDSVRLYHGNLLDEVTPKTPQDVDKVMRLNGRIYAVVKPMGLETLFIIGISVLVSVAMAFLMPVPAMPNQGSQPPSPNNALTARTNRERLGGRIPDIYGTVWSIPDLIAPTYSVYVNHKEVEYSYMCVGRGKFEVSRALDDATPINEVVGSGVLVYDPDTGLNDSPIKVFGEQFDPNQAEFARLAAKRYTSVNGQELSTPEAAVKSPISFGDSAIETGGDESGFDIVFTMPISEVTIRVPRFAVGNTINFSGADALESANGLTELNDQDEEVPVTYNLNGDYEVISYSDERLELTKVSTDPNDFQKLIDNNDSTVLKEITVQKFSGVKWQGWHYTQNTDHDVALINLVALNGLYLTNKDGNYYPLAVEMELESEIVDVNSNPIAGTLVKQVVAITSPTLDGIGADDDTIRRTAGKTIVIDNSHYEIGKRLRFRIAKLTKSRERGDDRTIEEVKIADFYSARIIPASDMPKGVTTVYTKTLATEGALSLKERKLRLLVQRYVTDATTGLPKLSNRADDILRDIATDPKIGNLQLTQVDIAQIKAEIDAQIAYFGTDKCSEFCGTFDDNNLSAEETMQIVSKAVFSQAKRQGNKIMLDFERKVPASVAVFNSHNILPDTFTAPQSLGIANDYDGVKVEYTDPIDDAIITMTYPNDAITNPHEDKLIGVRNKVQAHTHIMRMHNKDRHAYKSCEFVAGDESNIVVRTNRITVADQLRADVQQGSVDSIEIIDGKFVMHTTEPVNIGSEWATYTAFIQTINNGVEAITVRAYDDYSVEMARLPSGEISGSDRVVQAVYQIVTNGDEHRDAYLVAQKDPSDGMTNKLLCTNYDDRYYQNDSDYKNGLIT